MLEHLAYALPITIRAIVGSLTPHAVPPFDGWVAIVCVTVPHALHSRWPDSSDPVQFFTGQLLETVKGSTMYMTPCLRNRKWP